MMGADERPRVFKRCHLIPATYEDAWRIVQVPDGLVFGQTGGLPKKSSVAGLHWVVQHAGRLDKSRHFRLQLLDESSNL